MAASPTGLGEFAPYVLDKAGSIFSNAASNVASAPTRAMSGFQNIIDSIRDLPNVPGQIAGGFQNLADFGQWAPAGIDDIAAGFKPTFDLTAFSGLADTLGNFAGSTIADMFSDGLNTGVGSQIGGLVGGFAGSFIPVPVLGTAVGTLIGKAIGGLFGPGKSVGPGGTYGWDFATNQATGISGDNGWDGSELKGFAEEQVGYLRELQKALGGTGSLAQLQVGFQPQQGQPWVTFADKSGKQYREAIYAPQDFMRGAVLSGMLGLDQVQTDNLLAMLGPSGYSQYEAKMQADQAEGQRQLSEARAQNPAGWGDMAVIAAPMAADQFGNGQVPQGWGQQVPQYVI